MSRSLDDLHPDLREKCEAWLEDCADAGLDVFITHTWRSLEEQTALWRLGRDENGTVIDKTQVVTWVSPEKSKHTHSENSTPSALAFDFAFRDQEPWGENHPWGVALMLGVERHGLRHIAGYDVRRQRFAGDMGHLELCLEK